MPSADDLPAMTAAEITRFWSRSRILLLGLVGNLLLLLTMCSASLGTLRETWILGQEDDCLDAWELSDDPRTEHAILADVVDEEWVSRHEARFLLRLPVADGDGETVSFRRLWLSCEAHEVERNDVDVTVVDHVELES